MFWALTRKSLKRRLLDAGLSREVATTLAKGPYLSRLINQDVAEDFLAGRISKTEIEIRFG